MRVKVLLQITADNDGTDDAAEIVAFDKPTERPDDLGLSIAEAKALLGTIQRQVVEAQVASWTERHRCCETCGMRRRSKGSYPMTFMTLHG